MRKLFSLILLGLLCSVGNAWGDATTIVSFASGTWTGGTATYTSKGTLDSDKLKLASSDATGTEGTKHVQVVLSSGSFQTGDAISITYYASSTSKSVTPGFFFGTISNETFTSAASIQADATSAGSSSPATQTNLIVPEAANGSNVLRLTRYTGGTALYITAISISRPESYTITWQNGGHGTAPTLPTSANTFALPTMDADGGYVNTGWTANVAVTYGGSSRAAGYVLPVGGAVTLSSNTTFTGVWKAPSTFALTSDEEIEVAIAGTSQIEYENNAGTVTYESADPSVATVSASGLITAVAGGKTTITVTDPGTSLVAGGEATVTVLVPYPNPAEADTYKFTIDKLGFSNTDNTKHYFTNGFVIDASSSHALQYAAIESNTGIKFSHARTYTIHVPSNVTVTYAEIEARGNYASGAGKAAANWGTVFGTDYSEIALPYSDQDPSYKDFVIASPAVGGTLVFTPGGNEWQAIINLHTDAYIPKHSVSYAAGDGTGSMDGSEIREGSSFTLPIQGTIVAPAGKYFTGWNDGTKGYVPGDSYTMSTSDVTFTAQWATSAESNHYHYSYKDATRYDGSAYMNPLGTAAESGDGNTVTNGDLCSSLGGITSVATTSAKYDGKGSHINAYLKIEKGGTAKVTITIASGYVGILKIKANGYSKNAGIAVSNSATKLSGSEGGVATIEDNFNELVYVLKSGSSEITCGSNNMYISEMDITTAATVSGTITAEGWTTFSSCYPLDLNTISTGYKAYVATSVGGGEVTLTPCTDKVEANTGLMIKGTANNEFTISTTADDATFSGSNLLVGAANGASLTEDDHAYVLAKQGTPAELGFYLVDDDLTIPAGKAYLVYAGSLSAPSVIRIVDEENNATNIDNIGATDEAVKFIQDGKLFIKKNGVIYDAMGHAIR